MTWNRAHKPTADIIPFPLERAKERKPVGFETGERGRVLLYTGVRYERWEIAEPKWRSDDHRPRRGGSRS